MIGVGAAFDYHAGTIKRARHRGCKSWARMAASCGLRARPAQRTLFANQFDFSVQGVASLGAADQRLNLVFELFHHPAF